MMRALCVWLKNWPIDLRRRARPADRRAMVLTRTVTGQAQVSACCSRAAVAGVTTGMALADARALLGDGVAVEPADPVHDAERLAQLAKWSTRWLPRVAPDPASDSLLADISGCERLYGGEDQMIRRLRGLLRRGGLSARIATGPTFGCAWAAAHHDPEEDRVIDEGQAEAALSPLPIAALRVGADTVWALEEVGLTTIGQLLAMPRRELPARFNADLLLRLDQALGRAIELIDPVRDAPDLSVSRPFAGPVSQVEAITLTVRELLAELTRELLALESGVRRLRVGLDRYQWDPVWCEVSVARPTRDPRHLWQLLAPKLERLNHGEGVDAITLTALSTARLPHRQMGAEPDTRCDDKALGELLDVLTARLGERRVVRVSAIEAHQPQHVFQCRPAVRSDVTTTARLTPHARPSRLLYPPEPIDVIAVTPDGPIARVTWRGCEHRILTCAAPERIGGAWWLGDAVDRDYFRVQLDDGRWLWLSRELDGRTNPWAVCGRWM